MLSSPFISIIIPTYNRCKLLPLTIDSFINQDYAKNRFEIIISDNNSTDNTQKIVNRYLNKTKIQIKYHLEIKQGVHYARNEASKLAKGDIFYFTDDDMIANSNLLSELVKVFELDDQIGCASGMVIPKFEKNPPLWVKKYLINGHLSLTELNKDEELVISKSDCNIYSCHQAIRKTAFIKSGGFNPENTAGVWIGDGETGLNSKIKELGYKFAYTSKSIIHHIIPESRTTVSYLIKRLGNQGFCDSYTEYRNHRNINKLILGMIRRNCLTFLRSISNTTLNIIRFKLSYHFLPARIIYFHKRNVYDIKLLFNKEFRKTVEVNNWLSKS